MNDQSRLDELRRLMLKKHIDVYLVVLSDYHSSENVVEAFQEIRWLSGFSGTNATIIVTQDDAGLWTDGRYFIQAKNQIKNSGIRLFPMGEEGVPDVYEYIDEHLKKGMTLGYDGRVVSLEDHERYKKLARGNGAGIKCRENLIDSLWTDRPQLPCSKVWILSDSFCGESVEDKLGRVSKLLQKRGADAILVSDLCDIAWLLNIRGNDIDYVPVALSFFYLGKNKRILYIDGKSLSDETRAYFEALDIEIHPYESVFSDIRRIRASRVMIDPLTVNAAIASGIPFWIRQIKRPSPITRLKAVKNKTEIKNTRLAHIKDGVAVTKFIYRIKTGIGIEDITECSAADILHDLRAKQEHFIDESFSTISAYGANAAMMHYEPDRNNDVKLQSKGFLLVDSGGHYFEGTTDITRTIVLGPLTPEEIHGFTLTLRGALRLMAARFPKGTLCQGLDVLARGPFWDEGLDYRCGTGHGVGHILSVHEGPNGFRSKITKKLKACPLLPGMITTDEPGLYEEGKFGVRIENELLCVSDRKTEYGSFLRFENITMAPIDLDAVDLSLLTEEEKNTLNEYHKRVYDTLLPFMDEDEAVWLRKATKAV